MTALPPKPIPAADLLGGDDVDFVVNLYIALLGRWPDPNGLHRYLGLIANRPERRLDCLREIAGSEEAQKRGTRVAFGSGPFIPPSPAQVALTTARLRSEHQNQ